MKKIASLFSVLLFSFSIGQTTNYYDANGNKIGYSKIISTPESTLDKMIEQQQQGLLNASEQGRQIAEQTIEQKLREYNYQQQLNQLKQPIQTTTYSSVPKTIYLKDSYNKTFTVNQIKVYDKYDRIIRIEPIKDGAYILIQENQIIFQRADGTRGYRNLIFKNYTDRTYKYSSEWGDIHIHENLRYVKFFNPSNEEYYQYFIKQ